MERTVDLPSPLFYREVHHLSIRIDKSELGQMAILEEPRIKHDFKLVLPQLMVCFPEVVDQEFVREPGHQRSARKGCQVTFTPKNLESLFVAPIHSIGPMSNLPNSYDPPIPAIPPSKPKPRAPTMPIFSYHFGFRSHGLTPVSSMSTLTLSS